MPTLIDKVLKMHALAKEVREEIRISKPEGITVVYHDGSTKPHFSIFPDGKCEESAELELNVDGSLEVHDFSKYKSDMHDISNALLKTLAAENPKENKDAIVDDCLNGRR